jgi:hypothetical protein
MRERFHPGRFLLSLEGGGTPSAEQELIEGAGGDPERSEADGPRGFDLKGRLTPHEQGE